MRNSFGLLGAAVLVTVFIGVPAHVHGLQAPARAQARDPHHPDPGTASAPVAATPEQRPGMMDMTKMMGEMKASDAKLDTLVRAMNAAEDAEKTEAIAAVVTALVEERRSMHSSMAAMMNMMGMMHQMTTPSGAAPSQPKP